MTAPPSESPRLTARPAFAPAAIRAVYRVKKPGQHSGRHDASATINLVNPALNREKIGTTA